MADYNKELSKVRGPFRVYPKKKKKEPISTVDEYQNAFIEGLEAYDVKQKKPVRWNFLKDNEGLFNLYLTLDPVQRMVGAHLLGEDPVRKLRKTKKISERDYIDGFDEIAKGIDSGSYELGTSLGELLFMGTDLLRNTDFSTAFQKMMEKQKPEEPETWRGDLTALMIQFAIPGTIVTKIGLRAKKLQKVKNLLAKMGTSKVSKVAQRVGAGIGIVGVTDFIVSPDKRRIPTLFVQPTDTSKLSGRKKAVAMLMNRVRYGAEGSIIGGGFPLVGKSIQQLYKWGARPVGEPLVRMSFNTVGTGFKGAAWLLSQADKPLHTKIVKSLAKSSGNTIKKIISPLTQKIGMKKAPPFEEWRLFQVTSPKASERGLKRLDDILSWFRSFGKSPKDIEGVSEQVMLHVKGRARKIDKLLEALEKRAYALAKKYEQRYNTNNTSKPYEKMLLDDIVDFLEGKSKLGVVDKTLRPIAFELKNDINKILKEFGNNLPKGTKDAVLIDLRKALTGKIDNYIIKSFAIFTKPKFTPDKTVRINARNWIAENVVRKNKDLREAALSTYGKKNYIEKYADDIINDILAVGRTGGVNPVKILQRIGSDQKLLRMDKFKFLKTGEELPQAIRRLLGQEKDLKSQVLFTVSDAIAANAKKMGFDMIAKIGLKNGWLFKTAAEAKPRFVDAQQILATDLKRLGNMKSELENLWTSPELKQTLLATGTPLENLARIPVFRQLLQFKVAVQAGKTLYSPQTQVRNVTSASFFALWNGHVGHNASVIDAMKMVMKDIFRAGKGGAIDEVEFSRYVEKLVRLGVWDENIVAQELRAVMTNLRKGVIKNEDELFEKIIKGLPTDKVARLYAGGDNLWKQFGYEFFKSDLSVALKNVNDVAAYLKLHNHPFSRKDLMTGAVKSLDEALDEAAAFMLRNTYPTYSKVPPVIQGLRNIPLIGNFVSFPSEMLRTATRSIAMSLRNIMLSDSPAIRQMGYKNLIGAYLAVKGIGKGAHAIANFVTGNSAEQWEAYKRSGAAPWDKNSNLIGIIPWKNGESAAINFSYFSPYDVLERPVQAALTMAHKKNIAADQIDNYALSLMFAEDGPLMELLQPFISPAIGYERIQDVVHGDFLMGGRSGVTAEGFKVYSPTDSLEDKFNKAFAHIVKGASPGLITSGMKLKSAIEGDVSGAGKPMRIEDELMALFTGTRIIRIDVKNDLRWRTSEVNRLLRAVDETEKFYRAKGFIDRPPSVMVDEFEKMQGEAFEIQRNMYMVIKDLQMLDLSKDKIEDIMVESGMNKKMASALIDGEFTPIKYSVPRFETKVDVLKDLAKFKTKKSDNFIYNIKESYVFPEDKLDSVYDKWEDRKFFPEGYKPELEGAVTNDKGTLVYDERGKIKKEPTLLEKVIPKIRNMVFPGTSQTKAPLPQTPMPDKRLVASTPQINQQTGLTRTETALLSPSEQEIARRT